MQPKISPTTSFASQEGARRRQDFLRPIDDTKKNFEEAPKYFLDHGKLTTMRDDIDKSREGAFLQGKNDVVENTASAMRGSERSQAHFFSELLKVFVDLMLMQAESIPRNMKNVMKREIEEVSNINASNIASMGEAIFAKRVLRSNP